MDQDWSRDIQEIYKTTVEGRGQKKSFINRPPIFAEESYPLIKGNNLAV